MPAPQVQFVFDFGSPNAYLAHRMIPSIEQRTGAKFDYFPALLGGIFKLTNNRPPMVAFGEIRNKMAYEQLEMRRFIARHNLTQFKFNPNFPVNTLLMMRLSVAAKNRGVLPAVAEAMFRAMWEEGKKMDDPALVAETLAAACPGENRLMDEAQSPDVKQQLQKNTEDAVERGVFGSPSFFVGNEIFFGKDRLGDVEAEIVRTSR